MIIVIAIAIAIYIAIAIFKLCCCRCCCHRYDDHHYLWAVFVGIGNGWQGFGQRRCSVLFKGPGVKPRALGIKREASPPLKCGMLLAWISFYGQSTHGYGCTMVCNDLFAVAHI